MNFFENPPLETISRRFGGIGDVLKFQSCDKLSGVFIVLDDEFGIAFG